MQQLVGRACVVCGQRIGSVVEGRFCPTCGNAVHNGCVEPGSAAPDKCPDCGGDRTNPAAMRGQFERSPEGGAPAGVYPVSRVCPACGHAGFERVDPARWVSYGMDRVCRACGTRYTPPTPAWAGVVFVLIGLLFLALGIIGAVYSLLA